MDENQGVAANRPGKRPRKEDASEIRRRLEELHEDIDFLIHEVRTPLTAVISSAEFLMERPISPHETDSLLTIIREEALRINDLLDNFHCFHRQESEAWLSRMSFSAVEVADLLGGAATRFRNASRRHAILLEVAADLPPVRGDRMKLELVLRNLVANAIKYSPGGGTITLSARQKDEAIVVGVRDTGIGIAVEDQSSIFDRNFRIDRPEGRTPRGSGQGLAIVARIVANHGGTLRVESEPGAGSAFYFTLPTQE